MTKLNLVLIAVCLTAAVSLGGEVKAQSIKDVNVANEPNVNVLNNVASTITNDTTNPVPVVVQNGPPPAPVKEIVEITKQGVPGVIATAYTVPTGKTLIITDVNISSSLSETSGNSPCCAIIARNGVGISVVNLRDRNYQRKYQTGIEFNEGDIVGGSTASRCGVSLL